jgi:hypothetical protein
MLPDSWRFGHQLALDLARRIEHLAWADRADGFDAFFLRQAETMLRPQGLSDLTSGDRAALAPLAARDLERRAARFAGWSRAITCAVLLELGERLEVSSAHQALTYLLSGDLRLARLAAGWTAEHGMAPVERLLPDLPGYALVLLAICPNDTAERFIARDAFWAAVTRRS